MNNSFIEVPKVEFVNEQLFANELAEIINIDYDLWTLRVTISFNKIEKPVFYVQFKNIVGFRVLDEGNLLEFWNPEVRVSGWIWRVKNGGWYDLEKSRKGFVEGYIENDLRNEYLILGEDKCLSVITYSEPEFIDPE